MFPELLFNHFFLSKLGGITNDPHGSRTEENGPDRLGYTAVIAPRFEFSSEGTLLSFWYGLVPISTSFWHSCGVVYCCPNVEE